MRNEIAANSLKSPGNKGMSDEILKNNLKKPILKTKLIERKVHFHIMSSQVILKQAENSSKSARPSAGHGSLIETWRGDKILMSIFLSRSAENFRRFWELFRYWTREHCRNTWSSLSLKENFGFGVLKKSCSRRNVISKILGVCIFENFRYVQRMGISIFLTFFLPHTARKVRTGTLRCFAKSVVPRQQALYEKLSETWVYNEKKSGSIRSLKSFSQENHCDSSRFYLVNRSTTVVTFLS